MHYHGRHRQDCATTYCPAVVDAAASGGRRRDLAAVLVNHRRDLTAFMVSASSSAAAALFSVAGSAAISDSADAAADRFVPRELSAPKEERACPAGKHATEIEEVTNMVHWMHMGSITILFIFFFEISTHAICMGIIPFLSNPFLVLDLGTPGAASARRLQRLQSLRLPRLRPRRCRRSMSCLPCPRPPHLRLCSTRSSTLVLQLSSRFR